MRTITQCESHTAIAVVTPVVTVLEIPYYAIEYVTFQPGSVVVVITLTNESFAPAAGNVTQVSCCCCVC